MPVSMRPYRRCPVHCADRYDAWQFLKLPLAYCSAFCLLITGASRRGCTVVKVWSNHSERSCRR